MTTIVAGMLVILMSQMKGPGACGDSNVAVFVVADHEEMLCVLDGEELYRPRTGSVRPLSCVSSAPLYKRLRSFGTASPNTVEQEIGKLGGVMQACAQRLAEDRKKTIDEMRTVVARISEAEGKAKVAASCRHNGNTIVAGPMASVGGAVLFAASNRPEVGLDRPLAAPSLDGKYASTLCRLDDKGRVSRLLDADGIHALFVPSAARYALVETYSRGLLSVPVSGGDAKALGAACGVLGRLGASTLLRDEAGMLFAFDHETGAVRRLAQLPKALGFSFKGSKYLGRLENAASSRTGNGIILVGSTYAIGERDKLVLVTLVDGKVSVFEKSVDLKADSGLFIEEMVGFGEPFAVK